MTTPIEQATRFLSALYSRMPAGARVGLWTVHDKKSHFFEDHTRAAEWAVDQDCPRNTYVHAGFCRPGIPANRRGTTADAVGISALWIDVDILREGHKKQNLPPTLDDAWAVIRAGGRPEPSLVLETGGGLQAWWLLDEPWVFANDDDRHRAYRTSQGFQAAIKFGARELGGWDVDSTHDLARVMRVAGTWNVNHGEPHLITIVSDTGAVYRADDFAHYARLAGDDPAQPSAPKQAVSSTERAFQPDSGGLRLNPSADPPGGLRDALFDTYPGAKASWNHRRRDLHDQSMSAYDMSLASYAVNAGWNDQQIADLLIAHRRKHGADLKLDRSDNYYERTIRRARREHRDREQRQEADEVLSDDSETASSEQRLRALRVRLGINLERIIRYRSDPAEYRIVVDGRNEKLGGSGVLLEQQVFRKKMADLKCFVPKIKDWDTVARTLLEICEDVDPGDEGSPLRSLNAWISSYLDEYHVYDDEEGENWSEAAIAGLPYIRNSKLHVANAGPRGVYDFVRNTVQLKEMTQRELAILLTASGWKSRRIKARHKTDTKTHTYYLRPIDDVRHLLARYQADDDGDD